MVTNFGVLAIPFPSYVSQQCYQRMISVETKLSYNITNFQFEDLAENYLLFYI